MPFIIRNFWESPSRSGFGAPEYLSIRNFQDCLGTKNTQWCLPVQKPNLCLQESWVRLQSKFEGEPCSSLEVSITNEDGKAQLIMINRDSVPLMLLQPWYLEPV